MTSVDEGFISSHGGRLFYRSTGDGSPLIALHGGPDFDHNYLLPEIDLLASGLRLVLYDQRGRGRSADGVRSVDVSLDSEIEDLDAVRTHLELGRIALVGHSWGGLLAAAYAVRHPERVSHLILMDTAPLSHETFMWFRNHLREAREPEDLTEMQRIAATPEFQSGDVEVEAAFYRLHFKPTVSDLRLLDAIVGRLRVNFTPETLLLARAIEERLYEDTWKSSGFDLVPALSELGIPTLVLLGDNDFIPVTLSEALAGRLRRATLTVISHSGHFAYAERPNVVMRKILEFVSER